MGFQAGSLQLHLFSTPARLGSSFYPMVTLFLRPYLPRDRPACLALLRANTPVAFTPAEELAFVQWLDAHEAAAPGQHYYVAERPGKFVGCGGFSLNPVGEAIPVWGMVAPAQHRQGIGRELLAYCLTALRTLHPNAPVHLDRAPRAAAFFQRCGLPAAEFYPASGFPQHGARVQMPRR
jgi:GNAT superfamily N-acetyltransferase